MKKTILIPVKPDAEMLPALREERLPDSRNPAAVYLASLAGKRTADGKLTRTQRIMDQSLRIISRLVSGREMDPRDVTWWTINRGQAQEIRRRISELTVRKGTMEKTIAIGTMNRHLSALRGVLKESWRQGLLDGETYQRVVDIRAIPGSPPDTGRALPAGEIVALFSAAAAQPEPMAARDSALLAILFGAGLRRSEAVALDVNDWNPKEGELIIRAGKGGKGRTVFLSNGASDAVEDWLAMRSSLPGPMFPRIRRVLIYHWVTRERIYQWITNERLSDQAVMVVMKKLARAAGVPAFSPHDLRRSFATVKISQGVPLPTIQADMGHQSVITTARYDRSGKEAQREGAKALHVPYRRAG